MALAGKADKQDLELKRDENSLDIVLTCLDLLGILKILKYEAVLNMVESR